MKNALLISIGLAVIGFSSCTMRCNHIACYPDFADWIAR